MKRLAKYTIAGALALGGVVTTVAASSAMPLVPVGPAAGLVENVAYGCGPGWHPNPWGRCVPYRRVVVYPGYYYGPSFYVGHPHHRWHRWHRW
ncbi:hypothetical protein LGH82_14890 [Mesorhizobium sp. PAMC28654]|uniref:GCG_CRPN prefix-to-repeats domain-containing protein n=1 Tax=Mesorhizobium sp. PAMC28654 TaxID=2880934 RepID=UPI001D0A6862|nr:hypothetical protein [Mesorhizobium sp. PAMC28654]UDL92391.1 hypothetical protein LGH82_14890 [Mesorhizobium sp. PAMC28654]